MIFKGKEQRFRITIFFSELKEGELKDIEVKIKREIEELFFKLIIVSVDDMNKFEEKDVKKKRPIKNTCYDLPAQS